jgi:hypothetical protein
MIEIDNGLRFLPNQTTIELSIIKLKPFLSNSIINSLINKLFLKLSLHKKLLFGVL